MAGLASEFEVLRGHKGSVLSLAVPPAGARQADTVVSGGEDGIARLWDLRTRKAFCGAVVGGPVTAVMFGHEADAHRVLCATGSSVLEFDLRASDTVVHRTPIRTIPCGSAEVNAIAVHEQGRFVAAVDDAGVVHLIERATARSYKRFRTQHNNLATCVRFRPRRTWDVLSGGQDFQLIRWDFSKGTAMKTYDVGVIRGAVAGAAQTINPPGVNALCLARSGRHAVTGLGDGGVIVTDLDAKSEALAHAVLNGHTYSVADVALLGPDETILSVGNDRRLNVWAFSPITATTSDMSIPLDPRRHCIMLEDKPNAMVCADNAVAIATTSADIMLFTARR